MKRASTIKIFLSFLFVFLIFNIIQAQETKSQPMPFVSEELWSMTAARDTTVRVLVTLRQEPISFGKDVISHAAEVASLQNTVLSSLPAGSYQEVKQYSHLPVVLMHINQSALSALAANPNVEAVNPDHIMYATDVEADGITDIGAVQALGYTGEGVRVAVMDTGIDTDHPGLSDDIFFQRCLLYASNQTTNTCPNPNSAEDGEGHGTHVSGIITGSGGVARDAQIGAFKVLGDDGTGYSSNTIDQLNYIVQNNGTLSIDVVNMSLGGSTRYTSESACDSGNAGYRTAISNLNSLGIVVFAATGNDGATNGVSSPGCNTGVIGVGSTDDAALTLQFSTCTLRNRADGVSCFSNTHPTQGAGEVIDLLAPGCLINAEQMGGGMVGNCGTSMATPMSAGIAAALLEASPGYSPANMETLLESTGEGVVDYRNNVTYPRINAQRALDALSGTGDPTNTPEPSNAPANDNFANALNITSGYNGDTTNFQYATYQTADPIRNCGGASARPNIWYRFTLNQTADVTLSTQGSTINFGSSTSGDTVMSLYRGTAQSSLTSVVCNDDAAGGGLHSAIATSLSSGTYYVMVTPYSGNAMSGASFIRLAFTASGIAVPTNTPVPPTATPVPPTATPEPNGAPSNDNFANALTVSSGYLANTTNFELATTQSADPTHSCRYSGASRGRANIWYRFTLSGTTTVTLSTQGSSIRTSSGTDDDTVMSLYRGTSLSGLTTIACHEDYAASSGLYYSRISRSLGAGTYYVQVSSWTTSALLAPSYIRFSYNTGSSFAELPIMGTELLSNGGFELNRAARVNQPSVWKTTKGSADRLQCNTATSSVALDGACAFRFTGRNGENAKLSQTINGSAYNFAAGDVLTASFQYKTNAVEPRLKMKLRVVYGDSALGVDKRNLTIKTASAEYMLIDAAQITLKGGVSKIKFQFHNRNVTGKVYIDNASLTVLSGAGIRASK